jgi:hypothetical protein
MLLRMFALRSGLYTNPRTRPLARFTGGWPVVAYIRPEPTGFGLTASGCEYWKRRILGIHDVGCKHMRAQRIGQGSEQCGDVANQLCRVHATQLESFAREDLRLSVDTAASGRHIC